MDGKKTKENREMASEFDEGYKRHVYPDELRDIRFILAVFCLALLVWILKEAAGEELRISRALLIAFRALFIAGSAWFIFIQQKSPAAFIHEKALFLLGMVFIAHQEITLVSRTVDYAFTSHTSIIIIATIYFTFPLKMRARFMLTLPMTVFEIVYIILVKEYPAGGKFTVVGSLVIVNLIGAIYAARIEAAKKKMYSDYITLRNTGAKMELMYRTIAHDIRAPFNGLLGYAGRLRVAAVRSGTKEVRRLSVVLDEMLHETFLLLENMLEWVGRRGRGGNACGPFNAGDALMDCVDLLRPFLLQKKLRLVLDLDSEAFIEGDVRAFQSVARNLIHNAVKFTPPRGKVSVTLGKGAGGLLLEIYNSGASIGPDAAARARGLFGEGLDDMARVEYGRGMGLGISFALARKNGWSLEIGPRKRGGTMARLFAAVPEGGEKP